MLRHCKRLVPMVPLRRFVLHQQNPCNRPTVRSLWSPHRRSDFGSVFRDLDRTFERLERDFIEHFPFRRFFPRSIPIQGVVQSGDLYRINIDVDGFKPEEISISLKENIITIQAKMERKAEDGNKLQQEFTREMSLPDNVDLSSLKTFLGIDGVLNIEASYKPDVKPKEIPVSRS
ncbi:stress-induced protein 1-like [Zootermopsis nevadensis]|uniref:Heat shock protein Hsp-16.1/Hsp-16.11 n=1 Tax=Zootermopsis nevadensis TaxID=136037 RepID=A0A067RG12_ZOONE|nr:stress-induced protein 1-like [Zootermopsis nevadensis]KDR22816.1 Heat shock protein Hsp-16.1/Hsp-16.11 [Zootermopsis nevadensis]